MWEFNLKNNLSKSGFKLIFVPIRKLPRGVMSLSRATCWLVYCSDFSFYPVSYKTARLSHQTEVCVTLKEMKQKNSSQTVQKKRFNQAEHVWSLLCFILIFWFLLGELIPDLRWEAAFKYSSSHSICFSALFSSPLDWGLMAALPEATEMRSE